VYVPAVISVREIGLDAPDAVRPLDEVTVYEVIGSLEKLGALNDTDTTPDDPPEADTLVGAVAGPFVAPADELRIGIYLPRITSSTILRVPLAFIYPGFSIKGSSLSSTSLAMSSLDDSMPYSILFHLR
jgi:hypothetical protein